MRLRQAKSMLAAVLAIAALDALTSLASRVLGVSPSVGGALAAVAVTPLWTRSEAHGALRDLPRPGPRAQAVIAVASLAFCAAVLLLGTWTVQATILAITAALVLVTVWLDAANTT